MANDNKHFTSPVDTKGRIYIPKILLSMTKISKHVEYEVTDDGLLVKPFEPTSLYFCSLCKSLETSTLIEVARGEYICYDCTQKIIQKVKR